MCAFVGEKYQTVQFSTNDQCFKLSVTVCEKG